MNRAERRRATRHKAPASPNASRTVVKRRFPQDPTERNHMDESEVTQAAMARVQAGIRAMASGDEAGALRQVNDASDGEARWMAASLLSALKDSVEACLGGDVNKARRVLLAAAEGMNEDIVVTGAAVVIDEIFRREGWS